MGLLSQVARSFYLSLRMLPRDLRYPVGLVYLLARAADTIADTQAIATHKRLYFLNAFRRNLDADDNVFIEHIQEHISHSQVSAPEARLLAAMPLAMNHFRHLPADEKKISRQVLLTLVGGMEGDLKVFPPEKSGQISALPNAAALESYTYHVAGCVGEFWTRMLHLHVPSLGRWDVNKAVERSVEYGKALQLVNVLRDAASDLRMGRCYLPEDELVEFGMTVYALRQPVADSKSRPLLRRWSNTFIVFTHAAQQYVMSLPRREFRLRLASIWPLMIAFATMCKLLSSRGWLQAAQPVKVNRLWLYRMVVCSFLLVGSNTLVNLWIRRWRNRLQRLIEQDDPAMPS